MVSRRTFLGAAALSAGAFAKTGDRLKLGVASYSFRNWPRERMIEGVKTLETQYVNLKEMHLRYVSTPEELAAGRKQFADAGLTVLGGGNIDLKNEAQLRAMFEYAKGAGFPLIVCAPSHATLPAVEKLVKEYNIKAAIHNHGPEDKEFPSPESVLEAVKGMDPRVGLCMDIGHATRAGSDLVAAVRAAGPRLLDMHVKDLKNNREASSQCIVGEGILPMKGIFAELLKMKYQGGVMLEYEIEASNPLPGMIKSFENMRKILAELPA